MVRLAVPLLLIGLPAQAATPLAEVLCDSTPRLEQRLSQRMGATRAALGLQGPEQVMEVWTDARGHWSLVVAYAGGTSCIVAMGEGWQDLGPPRDPA
ncbi:hypothetical protein KM176_02565 [Pseudooceanicola sp. CBS1P-1]|uniref:Uncharacterized protein n=1 Tax=Pseudooceanicola albus TaxID=2692189 RepID=A0A6L7FZM7_9RHOB|nr:MULTISPECIES: hypothetical protein [Pseudooceanicola]MBT9382733.1 hypothetical protein [Pseudooceanicola endophyticus]MXN17271.1 hypothetical protein [Pseudooceanicola albus]